MIYYIAGEASIVFDKCVEREKKLVEDKRGKYYTEEVHYNYDFIEDFQDLYLDRGSKVLTEQSDGYEVFQPHKFSRTRRGKYNQQIFFSFKIEIFTQL